MKHGAGKWVKRNRRSYILIVLAGLLVISGFIWLRLNCTREHCREKMRIVRSHLYACTDAIEFYQEARGVLPLQISPAFVEEYGWSKTEGSVLIDPFASPDYLRYLRISDSAFVLYSVGPDREDQGGQIEYDPSNGTYSVGDITLSGLAERDWWEL